MTYIAVGPNIEPEKNIRNAIKLLSRKFPIVGISRFYRSPAEGRPEQPPFVDGVIEIETDIHAADLKEFLRLVESKLGRKRTSDKFASRTIDLDMIAPKQTQKPYVAVPLHELAPDVAPAYPPAEDMEALPEFTEQLKGEVEHGPRKG